MTPADLAILGIVAVAVLIALGAVRDGGRREERQGRDVWEGWRELFDFEEEDE